MAIVCVAEDRKVCEPGLKLLIMSLHAHCRDLPLHIFYPPADVTFISWIKNYPRVNLRVAPIPDTFGWNVKPQAMLFLMDLGHDEIIWIDSDIIVTRDIASLFSGLDGRTMAVTEEALWGAHSDPEGLRARLWGFNVGRMLPFALNSAVIRVTQAHYSLLRSWAELLVSRRYREVQQLEWDQRPAHMVSDQDVLTALLASAEYAQVPLKILKRGDEIIQYFGLYGYTLPERVANLFGYRATFVHSQGYKPWTSGWHEGASQSMRKYIESVYRDLSPYTLAANRYAAGLDEDISWMQSHHALSSILRAAGFWHAPLVGLPIAAVTDLARLSKRLISGDGKQFRTGKS